MLGDFLKEKFEPIFKWKNFEEEEKVEFKTLMW